MNEAANQTGNQLNNGLDSITLGQLRAIVGSAPKPKVLSTLSPFLPASMLKDISSAMVVRLQLWGRRLGHE
jgi:hypothetical protein